MRHRITQPSSRVALVLLSALCILGCSAPSQNLPMSAGTDSPSAVRVGAEPEPLLPSPLQSYRLTPRELATITYARGLLIDRCMRAEGFSYPQRPLAHEVEAMLGSERTAIGRRYGISHPREAASYGYGFEKAPPAETRTKVDRDSMYLAALHGTGPKGEHESTSRRASPVAGCVGEADRTLGSADPDVSPFGLAHSLWVQGQQHLVTTSQYRDAVGDWAACMTRLGHRVSDPISDQHDIAKAFHARQAMGDHAADGRPPRSEVELATSDIRCKRETRLVERLDEITVAIDQRTIAANQAALLRDHQRLKQAVATAVDLISNYERS